MNHASDLYIYHDPKYDALFCQRIDHLVFDPSFILLPLSRTRNHRHHLHSHKLESRSVLLRGISISLGCVMSSRVASLVARQESQLLSNYPITPPPEGVTPDFTNPTNHGKVETVVTSILLGITVIFILNRIYVKTFIVRKYMLDDRKSSSAV